MSGNLSTLLSSLPPRQRLALAYARSDNRDALLTVLALDVRLAGILRHSREPMLAQLRFAWWRENLSETRRLDDSGDPLLAIIGSWPGPRVLLVGLVDGWERLVGNAPLPVEAFSALADARAEAIAVLVDEQSRMAAHHMACNWALVDIASHLSDAGERNAVMQLVRARDWNASRLERHMRPLVVLHALAARDLRRGENPDRVSPAGLLVALRAGMIGF